MSNEIKAQALIEFRDKYIDINQRPDIFSLSAVNAKAELYSLLTLEVEELLSKGFTNLSNKLD